MSADRMIIGTSLFVFAGMLLLGLGVKQKNGEGYEPQVVVLGALIMVACVDVMLAGVLVIIGKL